MDKGKDQKVQHLVVARDHYENISYWGALGMVVVLEWRLLDFRRQNLSTPPPRIGRIWAPSPMIGRIWVPSHHISLYVQCTSFFNNISNQCASN